MSAEKDRILKQMEYINDAFIEPSQRNKFFGEEASKKNANSTSGNANYITTSTLLYTILDHDSFITAFLPNNPALKSGSGSSGALDNVYINKREGNNYPWYTANQYKSKTFRFSDANFEYDFTVHAFNFSLLFNSPGTLNKPSFIYTKDSSGTDVTKSLSILELLNAIRITYNLLEPQKWKTFLELKDDEHLEVDMYQLEESANKYKKIKFTLNSTARDHIIFKDTIHNLINNIDDHTITNNLDVMRRILLGYENMIHVYLAGYLYKKDSNASTTYKHFLETTIRHFNRLNNNFYTDSSIDTGIQTLYKELERRTVTYRNSKADITIVNDKLENVKKDIQMEKNYIDSHKDFYEKSQGLFYIFMFIFLIALAYLVIGTVRGNQRITAVIVFAISIVSILVLYSLTQYVMIEPFGDESLLKLYNLLTVENVFGEYVSNTLNVIQTIDTYRTYGDVSKSIAKEHRYYTNLHTQLANDKEKLNAVQMNYYREGRILRYRIYMFLQVLAVISLFMIANNNSAFVYVPAAFVVLFIIYLYIFNVNNLVRTDSRKYYWGEATV